MSLKRFEKSKYQKVNNDKVNLTSIEDYKQSHSQSKWKRPTKIISKKNILLGLLRKRQSFNEIRTIGAVENCRRLVFDEIESIFEQRESAIDGLIPELINGRKAYTHIFGNNDLEIIHRNTEKIIMNELSKRFNRPIVCQVRKPSFGDEISDIFSPIQKYQITKKRTITITSYMEAVGRRILSDSIESLMNNSLLAKLVCDIDICTMLLPKLGIDTDLETRELNKELFHRIGGALYSIKIGLIQEMNLQIANIFYETNDLELGVEIELKIQFLEENFTFRMYEPDLLEA
ncbi:conserved hypothetical protein [Candidatus Desulfosporosinus infrequens]|uniref:Uncharacterized protein n=1 Tax=Candidatus Desulfosporosinus infrequens TaxID=2043169 RepID=A0A2U3LIC5_9FIRM|nr:conserved hypothetical protein [Candidatus Desulfosporosinus infrequens]